jgi:hypothetical protein
MAETIATELRRVSEPARSLYKSIHGGSKKTIGIAEYVARIAWGGDGPPPATLCAISVMLIERMRQRERQRSIGVRLTMHRIAANIGISRGQLYRQWGDEIDAIHDELNKMLSQADSDLGYGLTRCGIVG